jgi:hypothetical protein
MGFAKQNLPEAIMTLTYVVPTNPRRAFKRGDIVDVMDRECKRMSSQRVTFARKNFIVTECGRHWNQDGWWIGENGTWPFPWIKHSRRKSIK